jgi:hypothetical protein
VTSPDPLPVPKKHDARCRELDAALRSAALVLRHEVLARGILRQLCEITELEIERENGGCTA